MDQGQGLLRAIRQEPEDDAVRLVYYPGKGDPRGTGSAGRVVWV